MTTGKCLVVERGNAIMDHIFYNQLTEPGSSEFRIYRVTERLIVLCVGFGGGLKLVPPGDLSN